MSRVNIRERAEQAHIAINCTPRYAEVEEVDSLEGAMGDLLTDLLHLAFREGMSVKKMHDMALFNFKNEQKKYQEEV